MKSREFDSRIQSLYFIALIPDHPVQSELIQFKEYARDVFNSSKSLNSPAHITLLPPFSLERKSESVLIADIEKCIRGEKSFYLELNGFGHFGNKVIFVNVGENETASRLHKKLHADLEKYHDYGVETNRKFHPHITVAFKDLIPEQFKAGWDYYSQKSFERIIRIGQVDLLRHDNKKWNSIIYFRLN